jgi:hypothetical protein
MSVPVKFSDTPPHYSGYWPVIDFGTGTIKRLVKVKSGQMYLCTSIPENTLPGRFILDSFDDSEWVNASVINNRKEFDFIGYSHLYSLWCIFTMHEGRLSISSRGEIYPLYWRRTNMTELQLLDLFSNTPL